MKKGFWYAFLFVFIIFLYSPALSYAQTPRYAECDACGYCIGKAVPESWTDCKNCLYPKITAPANQNKTLEIITTPITDPNNPNKVLINVPVPPEKGSYYTQLGCVNTSLSSFSDPGAVGGVLNFILTKLIFPATGVLAFMFLLYGAFLLITAQGAEMQVARGKRYITGAIVGLIFTFSVVLIVNIVGGDVLRIPGFGESQEIVIMAAGSMSHKNATAPFDYAEMNVYINNKLIQSFARVTGNLTAVNQYPNNTSDAYSPINVFTTVKSGEIIGIEFPVDYYPSGSLGDTNLYIQSVKIDGVDCTNAQYERYEPYNDKYDVSIDENFGMYWKGMLRCEAP